MRKLSSFVLCALAAIGCGSERDRAPSSKPVEPATASAAPAVPTAPPPTAPAPAAAAGTRIVDLAALADADGQTDLVRGTIEVPAHARVEVQSRVANGELLSEARIRIDEIEIAPELAELTSVTITIVELPEPGTFDQVKASYARRDLVRADKDPNGYTFVSRIGNAFAVNVGRGRLLCSAVGDDGNGILEAAVPVVVRACQSLRPSR